jgi:hypothetical protein
VSATPKKVLAGLGVFATALVFALWIGVRHQRSERSALVDRLNRAPSSGGMTPAGSPDLDTLPAPVARYLRRALGPHRELRLVRLEQLGTLRTDVRSERWMSFEAEHLVAPRSTGFVWNARVRVAPLLHVRVRDSLVEGRGAGQVDLLSAFTVAEDAGTPEMNSGSLHRYLAEAVWYPTALLPSAKLRWSAMAANSALATLTDHGVSVSLEFRFSDTGEVAGIYTPARWGRFDGGYRQVPWEGHFGSYEEKMGLLVPTEGEVGWYVDNEWHAVWKGRVTAFAADRTR